MKTAKTGALLRKSTQERISAFKKGNFDGAGFFLRLALTGALALIFVLFFGKFAGVYLAVKSNGATNTEARLYELLTIVYFLLLVSSSLASAATLNRELFTKDDLKLFSAMPLKAQSVYLAGLISTFIGQFLFAVITVLPINIVAAMSAPQGMYFYGMTVLVCILLPLLSVAIGSVLSLPCYALFRYLKPRYLLTFIVVTLLAAVGFWGYSLLLSGVKELLLGDDLKYFFNERIITAIAQITANLYPANLLAGLVMRRGILRALFIICAAIAACLLLSLLFVRGMMLRAMQARIAGRAAARRGKITKRHSPFTALMKKELLQIFRTPGYAFSCFSTAAILPLMVYFCMSVGGSLVKRLIGIETGSELALLLTLLFGSLTNVFCATNISREGENFYCIKALPVGAGVVMGAKVVFCLIVSALAQAVSALILWLTGFVPWQIALYLFGVGTLFAFAQICFSTRYDFSHAKFSTEEDGEARASGAAQIVLGILFALMIGGSTLIFKLYSALRLSGGSGLVGAGYFLSGSLTLLLALAALYYLVRRLPEKYYHFSGGGIL